jgi:phosphoglycerol transferase MdoB-like AlkP superfamily enzyme
MASWGAAEATEAFELVTIFDILKMVTTEDNSIKLRAMAKYSLAPAIPRIPVIAGVVVLLIYFLTRLGLAVFTGFDGEHFKGFDAVPLPLWPEIFLKGLWFDLCVASVLIAPICIYEALLPNKWRATTWHKALRFAWLWLAIALLLFGAVAESTFWLEFSTRFNFIALDYLIYTQEVIGNIRESYPVGKILAGIGAAAAIILLAISPAVRNAEEDALSWAQRIGLALFALIVPAGLMYFGNVDQMEQQYIPLVSSEATDAMPLELRKIAGIPTTGVVNPNNAFANELSGNGLFTIAAAQRRNELDYDKFYRTMPQPQANTALVAMGVKRTSLGDARKTDLSDEPATNVTPFSSKPKNIIMISVESLSAEFMDSYGGTKGLTPELDKLGKAGMKFDRMFATGTRTVRGLEALSLGTPPIPGQAIVRRPAHDHLSTMGELLKYQGFSTFFFYGGYGYFDNMNAYYAANNYRVIDRTDIPKDKIGFENVWGVADEYLFDHVIRTLDDKGDKGTGKAAEEKPFFAQIMTTSNHRPYTYPSGRIDIPSPGGRDGGVKYTDYAIGKFIKDASKKPWFKDTLFVIVADHCASAAGKTRLPVTGYHIPLIFYAPGLLKPSVFTPVVSQIDIAPTLMEVLGKNGSAQFYGRSFFEPGPALQRAFISNYQALGYLRDNVLTVLLPKQAVESYQVDPKTLATTPAPVNAQLRDEAIAYYQTASKAFKTGELKAPFYVKPTATSTTSTAQPTPAAVVKP